MEAGGAAIQDMVFLANYIDHDFESFQIDNDAALVLSHGISSIEYVEDSIGLNLSEVIDRWEKIPPIFVPPSCFKLLRANRKKFALRVT